MNVKIKLLADVELNGIKHFAGSVLEVDEKSAQDLIEIKSAESHEKAAADDVLKKTIKAAVGEELEGALAKAIEANPQFKLHDRSDDRVLFVVGTRRRLELITSWLCYSRGLSRCARSPSSSP